MKMAPRFDAAEVERLARKGVDWGIVRKAIRESGRPTVPFVEGPPTLNGSPHAGHLRGRVIKDLWYRYTTLTGKDVRFYGGWDTQGLPVELQAEKDMGITGKEQIADDADVEALVKSCKEIVHRFNKEWEDADDLLGVSMDHSNSYWTYRDGYIEREWQVLKRAREEGILHDDYTVIGYCPGCQTSLSHAEVNQGYETVRDPSLYYKVKMRDEDAYLVVWTTMPFTLVTDAMVGLHPDEEYAFVAVGGETWVVGSTRLEAFMAEAGISEYEVLRTARGSEFEGKRYDHPLAEHIPGFAPLADEYHTAVAERFVDVEAGSGLVHLAPANGEEDMAIAKRRNVKVFCPIDDRVRFTGPAGKYAGMYVRDADSIIVDDLRDAGALVKVGRITHKYPLCWRSKHPIIWLARRGWFYALDRMGSRTVRAAESVKYFFDAPKNRFLGIVGERHPWCISRERYWGCPLPVWECADCGAKTWCHSRDEIVSAAVSLPDGPDFELHRPWIDRVSVRCAECGGSETRREQYVLDTWHNSGAAPFASQADESYRANIPAPFFTEGIDQTRGWAYTLLVVNVILSGEAVPPYRAFLFQGHVLDEKGGKMSKSLGNVMDAREMLERHPADLIRLYFMWKASPVEPFSFDPKEMASRPHQILSTLYNLHLYYTQNSEYDAYDRSRDVRWAAGRSLLEPPDVWILSKLQGVIGTVTQKIEECRFHEAARAIDDFLIRSLSQAYVQSVRPELWEDDESKKDRRHAIYAVLAEALKSLDVMMHPFCPFTSEYLYGAAFGDVRSVLLEEWPRPDEKLVRPDTEEAFESVQAILSVASAARAKARLKRRWPLKEARVAIPPGKEGVAELWGSLQRRMNVDALHPPVVSSQTSGLEQYEELRSLGMPVVPVMSLDRGRLGPRVKEKMGGLARAFAAADPHTVVESIRDGSCKFVVDCAEIPISKDDVVIEYGPAEGYQVASRNGYTVFVPTTSDEETRAVWLLRDVARRLQNLRRERGYDPTDVLDTATILGLDGKARELVEGGRFDLAGLVRVRRVAFEYAGEAADSFKEEDIDGRRVQISIR